ncbi:hypothetical protein ACTXML_16980 [Glutamicibacter arilaitensis]|uniref:hypothetical protein n=1 Tax=Glutamicibacter arilaitensis TaxID=256701 RepID=UPI003FCF335C
MRSYIEIENFDKKRSIELLFGVIGQVKQKSLVVSVSCTDQKEFTNCNPGWYESAKVKMPFKYFPEAPQGNLTSVVMNLPKSDEVVRIYLIPWSEKNSSVDDLISKSIMLRNRNGKGVPFAIHELKKDAS